METIHTVYQGELRTKATHLLSGTELITDAPLDNKGLGLSFSPTDLVATALGSCMMTIMGIAAKEHGFELDGTEIKITKIMASNPRRIGEIVVELTFPKIEYTAKQKKFIEVAAKTCPVALSLHPELKQTVILNFVE